jgi:hypothetical protein
MVDRVYFPGARNATELWALSVINGGPSPLITRAVTYLGINKVLFDSNGSYSDIRLVSGSMDFLLGFGVSARFGTRALLLVDQHWRAHRLPQRKHPTIRWVRRKSHSQFGGATDFVYLFGVIGLNIDLTLSTLARSIGHVFDHSLEPSSMTTNADTGDYTLGSQLRIRNLTTPVTFQTHFAQTGLGIWVLTLDELGIAFGLPNRLRIGSASLSTFPLPPVQGLVGWLGALTASTRSVSTLPALIRREIHSPPTSTWFPKLSKSLGSEWIDEDTVSANAAKHDSPRFSCGTTGS